MKDKFCMLAYPYKDKYDVRNYYVSEKMNGVRCLWDGGVSRGMLCSDVSYANIEKDARYLEPPIATGLWTRYGKVIHAPDWFLDGLPNFPLDGELWLGRSQASFQELRSIVSQLKPNSRWREVTYWVFDSPPWDSWIMHRSLWGREAGYKLKPDIYLSAITTFETSYNWLQNNLKQSHVKLLDQQKGGDLEKYYNVVLDSGGEGLMLRNSRSIWVPKRSVNLLKMKPFETEIGVIVGVNPGTGKYVGMMGSLRVSWKGLIFDLGTGFTDSDRGRDFKIGASVSFRYRDLSRDGIPIEARYNGVV